MDEPGVPGKRAMSIIISRCPVSQILLAKVSYKLTQNQGDGKEIPLPHGESYKATCCCDPSNFEVLGVKDPKRMRKQRGGQRSLLSCREDGSCPSL